MSSESRKGVDQFDLYLASGLGTSQDKTPKETKCETLVDLVLNNKSFLSRIPNPPSCTQTPFGDIRVTDSESYPNIPNIEPPPPDRLSDDSFGTAKVPG